MDWGSWFPLEGFAFVSYMFVFFFTSMYIHVSTHTI